jgi:pimeloyl-ACP methyl ester carboxylesterase
LLAYTITLPLGTFLIGPGVRGVFAPQLVPDGYVENTATALLLRPREFLANARDLVTLKAEVAEQAPRYAGIKAPITIIAGDIDKTVSTNIHSRPLAATAPNVKLIVLPGLGHMVQNAVPDLVISEIEAMMGAMTQNTAAAANCL